jgi:hypothetical protein
MEVLKMVNNDRIVPIQKIDLLSMIGTVLTIANVNFTVLASTDILGNFSVTGSGAAGNFLANQPIQTLDFAEGVTSATVYFVAGYDFGGFTINGEAAAAGSGSIDVAPDGVTLYKAVLGSNKVTVSAVTPSLASE